MRNLVLFIALIFIGSCIDRLNYTAPSIYTKNVIVVDGSITDEPGPYRIRLTNPIKVDGAIAYSSFTEQAVSVRRVTLSDDVGNSEELEEINKGIYQTKPDGMRGAIGRSYSIRIETFDDKIFESTPDKMEPVGAVDSIYYEFEAFQSQDPLSTYGYRVYIDAHDTPGGDNYVRWKFTGTYVVETLPQYKLAGASGPPTNCPSPAPYPCSGWSLVNGRLKKGTYKLNDSTHLYEYQGYFDCTCCRCWVTQSEDQPHVSNKQFVENGKFHKIEVGFVPINYYTFFEKYRIEVQQMSLSQTAFYYWRAFQTQERASGSLFQPVTGKIPTNLSEINGSEVLGIFYASAVKKKQIYLDGKNLSHYIRIPVDCLGREGASGEICTNVFFPFATFHKPDDWVN